MPRNFGCCNRGAFTLVELLVVISVIGVLIALLLPAVQAAREAARFMTCQNHLKQIALAWQTHAASHNHFPTGGWISGLATWFTGDPDRGFGKSQPGTWTYNILPFIEQASLHDAGADGNAHDYVDTNAFVLRYETAIETYRCPTRHRANALLVTSELSKSAHPANVRPTDDVIGLLTGKPLAFVDYAANEAFHFGALGLNNGEMPDSYEDESRSTFVWTSDLWNQGVCFMRSTVRMGDVEDGTSNTYMVGERSIPTAFHNSFDPSNGLVILDQFANRWGSPIPFSMVVVPEGAADLGDIHSVATSGTPVPPLADSDPFPWKTFGSAHPARWNVAFCDGSVRSMSFDIDPRVHVLLGFRADGLPVDMSKLE